MSITRAVGSTFSIASTYGSTKSMTAITNATEAVATLEASHGIAPGDYFEVTSGWDLLNNRLVRAKSVATNDVTLEGIDTTDTSRYPTGTGTGSIREVTAWSQITQVASDIATSGGEQNYADVTTIADSIKKQIPTDRNPVVVTLPVFDDPSLAWYAKVVTASDSSKAYALLAAYSNGSKMVANAYWSLQKVPTIQDGTLRSQISLTFAAEPTRYST